MTEVSDYRRAQSSVSGGNGNGNLVLGPPDVSLLLLRPTTASIICDSNVMAKQLSAVHGRPLTQEERSALEGQVGFLFD